MIPAQFDGSNCVLVGEGCLDLPVFRDGTVVVSCWEMTDDERKAFLLTGRVYLYVYSGKSSPPVALGIMSPFIGQP